MQENRPATTLAGFLVICVSPILIMLLVGSLSFFLIDVFSRGAIAGSLRWVMFWFVLAIVLVSRIGIEQGTGHAMVYGLGLAAAVWLYMMRLFPAFILDLALLAVIWWCANKLVWDCTLINDQEDASGSGLLQCAADINFFVPLEKSREKESNKKISRQKQSPVPHPPGLWVVYFSLAALPLFGIGQVLLPASDLAARRAGFVYLFIYLAAAFGLLLVTSCLGLRRYLRQRQMQMPAAIALGWVRFGVCVIGFILVAAMLFPRPGAATAWLALRRQVDYRLHQASDYAMRFSPHGSPKGRPGKEPSNANPHVNPTAKSPPQNQNAAGKSPAPGHQHSGQSKNSPAQPPPLSAPSPNPAYNWLKILFFFSLALVVAWWIFRQRALIFQAIKSIIASVADFFRNLFGFRFSRKPLDSPANEGHDLRRPFAAFHNPFLTGKDQSWTPAQLILYSYEALRAWAREQGVEPRPEQTAREFCVEAGQAFPEIRPELNQLSILYGRIAYGMGLPANQNLEPLKELWRYFYAVREAEFAQIADAPRAPLEA